MKEKNIYLSILGELNKILNWCNNPTEIEDFELDSKLLILFEKNKINMSYGFFHPIYSLVDIVCDSIRHNQKEINNEYSVIDGINDLKKIIKLIELDSIEELEKNLALKNKLNNLYN
jgi:hypothetical protein